MPPNEELSMPNLGSFGQDAEKALEAVDAVLTFIDTYGHALPWIGDYVPVLEKIDAGVRGAEHLFTATPPQ